MQGIAIKPVSKSELGGWEPPAVERDDERRLHRSWRLWTWPRDKRKLSVQHRFTVPLLATGVVGRQIVGQRHAKAYVLC